MAQMSKPLLWISVFALVALPALLRLKAAQKPAVEPLATFTGTVQSIEGKSLTLQFEDSNTMLFRCTSKTAYYDGDKKIKASEIKIGDLVSVEGRRELGNEVVAVTVRRERVESK